MIKCKASLLTTLHIPGEMNKMANFASSSFHTSGSTPFSHRILQSFPITTGSFLDCMPTSEQATWKSHFNSVNQDTNAGAVASAHWTRQYYWRHFLHQVSTHTFRTWLQQNESLFFKVSQDRSRNEHLDMENKSKWAAFRQPLAWSPRPSNWLGLPICCITKKQPITMQP